MGDIGLQGGTSQVLEDFYEKLTRIKQGLNITTENFIYYVEGWVLVNLTLHVTSSERKTLNTIGVSF